MSGFEFNEQQVEAIRLVGEWYERVKHDRYGKNVFFLAGYAGTGKTTVAKTAATQCVTARYAHMIEYIAPTGKAASRLREKGCASARTMHQFTYNLRGEDEEGDPIFGAKDALKDGRPKLIVMDEASMVSGWDLKNLLIHQVPILALGDIGQLPPVGASAAFTVDNVDYLLDKIERQGADSNIVRASMFVRKGQMLPFREYDDVRVRSGRPPTDQLVEHSGEFAQILCSFNSTREEINQKVRKALGFSGKIPQIGEKVVCKFNQHGFGIMNGEQGIVVGYEEATPDFVEDEDSCRNKNEDDDGTRIILRSLTDARILKAKFNEKAFSTNFDERKEFLKKPGAFDFGYALTVHSSQGSEWPSVLVVEEVLRGVPYNQLMYTAITRAQQRLTIYRN